MVEKYFWILKKILRCGKILGGVWGNPPKHWCRSLLGL